jgi:HD-like signal output (HDOD) protein
MNDPTSHEKKIDRGLETAAQCSSPVILERFGGLPVFLPVAVELLRLIDEPDASQCGVARLVESDPGLATDTLTMANSPLFGFQSRVEAIPHAISLLGIERIRRLTTSVVLKSYLKGLMLHEPVRRVWIHSLASAVIAAEIAPRIWVSRDQAYAAGLLHDLGRIGMIAAYPGDLCQILGAEHESQHDALLAEKGALGLDHCEAGWWLAKAWALPESLWEISRKHHNCNGGSASLVGLVSFSCRLADSLGFAAVRCKTQCTPDELLAGWPAYQSAILNGDLLNLTEKIKTALNVLG